jgi:serine/threonine-protein kinase
MATDPLRWRRVNELFHAVLMRAPEEREAFLASECGADSRLRIEVQSLLGAHNAGGSVAQSLTAGTCLGDYEVTSFIAAGAMGQVYRAIDTKLGRDVALKILPAAFIADPGRRARFEREARLSASLNHPNIAQIYGVEESNGTRALVMELVEGETLADRIARGAIPIDEALPIAKQIADALEAAHEQGIVHRDLKPANIKLRTDGTVKVLDFGLAKLAESPLTAANPSTLSLSPTLTSPAVSTGVGVMLGTAAYMSPEQAKGKPIDRRGDMWAFGCVLFEMLTAKRAFAGEDVTDTIAAIVRAEPAWGVLPSNTPAAVGRLLRRCLEKDRNRRLDSAADARLEIDDALTSPAGDRAFPITTSPVVKPGGMAVAVAVGVVTLVLFGGGIAAWTFKPAAPLMVTRFTFTLPEGQVLDAGSRTAVAISPDATRLVYFSNNRWYLRSFAELNARPIAGTEFAGGGTNPVFSPDGESIAYWARDGTLKKIAISGGAPVTLCVAGNLLGMSWGPGGIVFGQGPKGILRVSANGGQPEQVAVVKPTELAHGPQVLPDGDTLLFTIASASLSSSDRWDKAQIVAQSLRTGERTIVLTGGADARYVPTGHLVYALGGVLFTVPFDATRRTVTGGPVPVVEGVRRAGRAVSTGAAQFSVSNTGSLVYIPGPKGSVTGSDLAFFDRKGGQEPLKLPPGPYEHPRVSPDGTRVVFGTDDGEEANVWIYELSGASAMRRLTFGGRNKYPIWSGDGTRVAFLSDREGDQGIFSQAADGTGTPQRLTKPQQGASDLPESWSPNNEWLLFSEMNGSKVALMLLSLKDGKVVPFSGIQATTFTSATFSPDGRWVAYSGRGITRADSDLFVQPFPPTGTKYQVTTGGDAHSAAWTPDGKELSYIPGARRFATLGIMITPTFAFSAPTMIPPPGVQGSPAFPRNYDIAHDGKRFIGVLAPGAPEGEASVGQIQVVLNWSEELKRLVPAK